MFKRVAILGPGLLGGSIALAVKQYHADIDLRLWGRREEPVKQAQNLGIDAATTNLEQAIDDAELIILATPVGVMPSLFRDIVAIGNHQALVTDVGSVKRHPHDMLRAIAAGAPDAPRFIGSHPMAGSEKAGIEAARADLVDGAACIVTNDENVESAELTKLIDFWTSLGCRVREMTAEDHDYAVARISHFPHLLASVGAMVGLKFPDIGELAGGGLRDTTRVASGDAELWTEILMENKDALTRSLRESQQHLELLMQQLEDEDRDGLYHFLLEAKRRRDQLTKIS